MTDYFRRFLVFFSGFLAILSMFFSKFFDHHQKIAIFTQNTPKSAIYAVRHLAFPVPPFSAPPLYFYASTKSRNWPQISYSWTKLWIWTPPPLILFFSENHRTAASNEFLLASDLKCVWFFWRSSRKALRFEWISIKCLFSVFGLGNRHNSSWLRCLCQTRPPPSPIKILWKKYLPKRRNFVFSHFSNWFHCL